jgi:hypothetical protein
MTKQSILDIVYKSGDAFLPEHINKILNINIIGSSKGTFYISGWSIIHLLNGVFIGLFYLFMRWSVEVYMLKMFALHTMWECWQILIGMSKPYMLTGGNNLVDTIVDTLLFMFGAYISLLLNKRAL